MTETATAPRRAKRSLAPGFFVALAAFAALAATAGDAAAKQAKNAEPGFETAPRAPGEPIMAIVSIKSQTVTFYDSEGWIRRAPVSTGTKGRETPAGVFAVVEKDRDHHSTMYDDAWMPHMQRITWNGIALHGGPLPGYAASHGCVRMPFGFAEDLFDRVNIGMRVVISPDDAAPISFSHPALLEPNPEALAVAPERAEALGRIAVETATAAADAKKAATVAAREVAAITKAVGGLEKQVKRADAKVVAADKAIAAAEKARVRAGEQHEAAAAKAADLATQLAVAEADAKLKLDAANAAKEAAGEDDEDARKAAAALAAEAATLANAAAKIEKLKTRADANLAAAEKAITAGDNAIVAAKDQKEKAVNAAADAAAELAAARSDADAKDEAGIAAKALAEETATARDAAEMAATDAKLATVPVSIYISRATGKLYVRRNTKKPLPDGGELFDFSIEVPVAIRDPERPIGTHIFTAMAEEGTALRWTAVSIEEGDGAREALDRISIPQEVIDRIGPTALPRSSIIISDEPLSKETNYRTEFVAVLNDQPQGGFITRKPAPRKPPPVTTSFGGQRNQRNQGDWFLRFWQ